MNGLCKPCAPHCQDCSSSGSGWCDKCDDGRLHFAHRCDEPCTRGCRSCHDTSDFGCDGCFFFYRLDGGGSCALNTVHIGGSALLVFAAAAGVLWCCAGRPCGGGGASSRGSIPLPLTHQAFIDARVGSALEVPSGVWRGYYTYSGTRHDVCEFDLQFDPGFSGRLVGRGVDDVAKYVIDGLHAGRRVAFTKTYELGSNNMNDVRTWGNQGHSVEYRGELAGETLGEGFRGTWTIHSHLHTLEGQFHLWPCMSGFSDRASDHDDAAGTPRTQGGGGAGGPTFEESECVVCYDRAISTRLRPCGHVALCGLCASRLSPRLCPLCRVNISSIENRPARASEVS